MSKSGKIRRIGLLGIYGIITGSIQSSRKCGILLPLLAVEQLIMRFCGRMSGGIDSGIKYKISCEFFIVKKVWKLFFYRDVRCSRSHLP